MKRRSERLKPVERLAEQRREQAAQHLARAEAALREHDGRLQELLRFRQDYCGRLVSGSTVDAARLQDFSAFLSRLDEAVVQQRQALAKQQQQVHHARRVWLEFWQQHRTMEHVVASRRREEEAAEARLEQKEADETARLLFQAATAGRLPGKE